MALLQNAIKNNNWENVGVNINGEYLNNLLQDLQISLAQVAPKINFFKTQYMIKKSNQEETTKPQTRTRTNFSSLGKTEERL